MRAVHVTIEPNAQVQVAFSGFAGRACGTERQRLSQALAQLGVALNVERVEEAAVPEETNGTEGTEGQTRARNS